MYLCHGVLGIALLLGSPAIAFKAGSNYVVHEERSSHMVTPIRARTKLEARHVLPIRIGLTQRDLDAGYDWLMDISHPQSPNYGKHWTAAQVNTAFAPTTETVQALLKWLVTEGIGESRISVSDNKGWLAFDATVEEAEKIFHTSFYEHEQAEKDRYSIGCDSYYLPEHLQNHVDYITPGVKHQLYKREFATKDGPIASRSLHKSFTPPVVSQAQIEVDMATKGIPLNCSNYVINGDCIRSLYGTPAINVNKKINPNNALGIFEQQGQMYWPGDLELFFNNFLPEAINTTLPITTSVDGGVAVAPFQNMSGGESMLDLSIAYAMIYPQKINYIEVDDLYYNDNYYYKGFGDTLLDALDGSFCTYSAFGQKGDNNSVDPIYPDPNVDGYKGPLECGLFKPPTVISFSYGPGENVWPVNYIKRQCAEYLKLALQGTTTVFASGDTGVANQVNSLYRDNTCLGDVFVPGYPPSCPYVLAVGATQIRPNVSGLSSNPEQAVFSRGRTNNYTSGGGFSNIFKRPSYQDTAVPDYFKVANNTLPYYETTDGKNIGAKGGFYNRRGRGIPDVSANGAYFDVYTGGRLGRSGGTSMSTPLWASIINLINEARLNAGKSSVGFLHPTLYAHPEAFHDITVGHNDGCGLEVAFETAAGWDPVTGLGTPKYEKLLEIFMSLP